MLLRKQILVVEDNSINREMLCEILSVDYTVLEAENGQEALDTLRQHGEDIALILLDVMMPVMDGYTFLEHVKADPELSLIPVIVMTQSDSEADEVSALSHGAADFVPKPYRPQVILHRVAGIINFRETAAMINQLQYDRLTGLYTKEFFCRKAQEILLHHPEKQYHIVCSDIENFKLYNDLFGVNCGDQLLIEMAGQCRKRLGNGEICGRLAADQFLCLREAKEEYTDDLFAEFADCVRSSGGIGNRVTIKWGIYEVTDRTIPVDQMCDRALLAAKSVKGKYHNYFAFYDDELRSRLLREQKITEEMGKALQDGQFEVYLQPKYSLAGDKMVGAEALVRWTHPELGFISPGEFIPLFEKNGFITRLDRYMWDRVCALLRQWKDRGYTVFPVSVNVSRADIYLTDLPDTLLTTIRRYDLLPSELHLEITESAYTENPEQIISAVEKLRNLGFVIELDDFGSGYSSLNMLNQMKFDILKLDMRFIQSETAKPSSQGVLQFIVGLARWMKLKVVAEGVETRDQLERLREIGCDYVQGYYFAKPMPCDAFEKLLKEQHDQKEQAFSQKKQSAPAGKCLLVVDEDADYRRMVGEIFGERFRVLEARDVSGALSCIEENKRRIAVIILSMSLPEQEGFTLLEKIGEHPYAWRIPVLATGPGDELLEQQALAMDADDYACKPHLGFSLRKRVSRLLGLTAYHERERHLQDEACRDYLTGLLNRRGYQASVNETQREEYPLAVYLFDLDELKKVNDTQGHLAGDQMLKSFGNMLRSHTRGGDILSRYGGDEFVVILKRIPSEEIALKKGNEICQAFHNCRLPGDIPASCSAGVVICETEEQYSEELIRKADEALYRAKAANKGNCCLWKETTE